MKRKFKGYCIAVLIVFGVVLAGCTDKGASSETKSNNASETKEISIAVNANFTTMDPHDRPDSISGFPQNAIYEGLVEYDENLEIVPVLAEDYKISEDGKVYTINLKEGVKFQDGTPFNADAVKVNLDRLTSSESTLSNSPNFIVVDKTEVIDDYTINIILKHPSGPFLNQLVSAKIISPKALEEFGKKISLNPVGTGPFKFDEWIQGEHLTVKKNPDYRESDLPKVDEITFKPVIEDGSRIAMLKTGEVDFIYPLPEDQTESLKGSNDVEVEETPSIIKRYVSMNNNKEPFNDVKVRQAINYAVNKEEFLKVVKNGFGYPLDSVLPKDIQYYEEQNLYTHNVEKAKELLKDAGYENGFKTEIWGNTSSGDLKAMQFLQQQLSAVGIELEIMPMEEGTLHDKISDPSTPEEEVTMWYVSWSQGDAFGAISPILSSDSFPPNRWNSAYYKNDKVDSLLKEAEKTADPEQNEELYTEIQDTIYTEAPLIFLSVDTIVTGKNNRIKGVYMRPDQSLSLTEAEVIK